VAATVYLRVSTDRQAESGLGLEAQLAQCEAAAGRLGLELSGVFTDAGVSGAKGMDRDGIGLDLDARPALLDAIDCLGAGDVLLVAKRDRLGRDAIFCALIERLVARRGASILSAGGEASGDSPSDMLMRRIIDAFSEYERLLIGARTRAAMRRLKASGKYTGGRAPFGRAVVDGELVDNDIEIETARLAEQLRASGLSLRAVGRELERRGLTPRNNDRWDATQIRRMTKRNSHAPRANKEQPSTGDRRGLQGTEPQREEDDAGNVVRL